MIIYAAYGSNISTRQMATRCPNAKVYGTGVIEGYRLAFYGAQRGRSYATLLPCEGESVPVLLWQITPLCEQSLDIYEGFPVHYVKEKMVAQNSDDSTECFAYIMNLKGRKPYPPSTVYYNTILDGYTQFGFPIDILRGALCGTLGGI